MRHGSSANLVEAISHQTDAELKQSYAFLANVSQTIVLRCDLVMWTCSASVVLVKGSAECDGTFRHEVLVQAGSNCWKGKLWMRLVGAR